MMMKTSIGFVLLLASCGGGAVAPSPGVGATSPDLASCAPGAELTGASYDVARSRFAFGSVPSEQAEPTIVRWVGDDGVVAMFPDGSEDASLNGGAPESSLPDWSSDPTAIADHERAYFATMGVASCQIDDTPGFTSGSGGTTAILRRAVDGIPVGESYASAHFVATNQTTAEGFYWPTIPADVVTAARALRDRLADPAALAAYKALFPPEAQGDGQVIIHHTDAGLDTKPFTAVATYDVFESGGLLGMGSNHHFDADGKEITSNSF
jgi:hypothetical protein